MRRESFGGGCEVGSGLNPASAANQQCETRPVQADPVLTNVNVYRGRQHFETIHEMISYHRLRANQLEALARSLPIELPVGASEILAQLVRGA